jgi:RNA polymerase sigma-70 factor (ECF subfamily)
MDAAEIEAYRDYLRLLARLQVASGFDNKVDISGVVQQTLWDAVRAPQSPENDGEVRIWLRRLLANNLQDELRKAKAARRDMRRERSLEADLEASSARFEGWLKSQHSSPSHRAIRAEELNRLAVALSQLPEEQRTAIELHHLQGLQLQAIAEQLGRSKEAVASLLYRALKKLKTYLEPNENRQ